MRHLLRCLTFVLAVALPATHAAADPVWGNGGSGGVPTSRAVNTSTPLTGGGALSADLTLACPTCVTTSRTVSTTAPLGGGGALSGDLTLTCTTCATGPGSSTATAVAKFTGTDGLTLGASAGVFIDASDRLGIATSSPVASLTLGSASSGLQLNNVDGANSEYMKMYWSGNVAQLETGKTGSGQVRSFLITGGGGASYQINAGQRHIFNALGTASAVVQTTGQLNASSGVQASLEATHTINQSGTATYEALRLNPTISGSGSGGTYLIRGQSAGTDRFTVTTGGVAVINNALTIFPSTAPPAGGSAGVGYKFSSTANLGVFFGSGAPTLSAAKGSLYLRTDGTGTNDRIYVNTDGGTTWTHMVTGSWILVGFWPRRRRWLGN